MRRNRLIKTGAAGLLCGLAALATLALAAPKNPPKNPPNGNGQVEIGLSKDSNVLDFENAAIGDNTNDSVVVRNDGKLAADFKLVGQMTAPQSASPLANRLRLVVTKGATQLYSGSVAGFNAATGFNLGTLYPQQGNRTPKNLTLNFRLSLPSAGGSAGDNSLQNLGPIDQRFRIDAVQNTGAQSNSPPNGNGNGPKPKQAVAGKSGSGADGGSTGSSPVGLASPGTTTSAAVDLAPIEDLGPGSGGKNGSPALPKPLTTPNAIPGAGNSIAPETASEGAGSQSGGDGPRETLLFLGIFGCMAALILWWSLRTPGEVGA
jgi:hypothetical protein